jgi:hypothetical protein
MDWMKGMLSKAWALVPGALNLVGDTLSALWNEVVDGHDRLSWWGLLAIAAALGGWML